MKPTLLLTFLFSVFLLNAQEPAFINASHFADVTKLGYDSQNARYVAITVKGRIYIKDQYKDYPTYGRLIGKMNGTESFDWVIELEKSPRDMKVVNDFIYVIEQQKEKTESTSSYSVTVKKLGLDGKELSKKTINETSGEKYKVFADARIYDSGILTWSKLKGKVNTYKVNGKEVKKELYSIYNFQFLNFDGEEIWSYQLEGGVDGYTDLRLQTSQVTSDGTAYLALHYGAKAKIGDNDYTSEILFDEGGHKLYVDEVVLLKLNKKGELEKSQEIAEYTLHLTDIQESSDGTLYLTGYHKGNEAYANSQDDGRPHRGMRFLGKTFEYSDEEVKAYSTQGEDGIVAALDANWKAKWVLNIKGEGENRASHIILTKDGFVICGIYSKTMKLGSNTYEGHPANKGYMNSYVAKINADGTWGDVTLLKSPNSTGADIYEDNSGNVLVVGYFKQNNLMINDKSYMLPGKSKFAGFFFNL